MKQVEFNSEATAKAFYDNIRAKMGYPSEGRNVGGGIHAPPVFGTTECMWLYEKHPTKNIWAHPMSAEIDVLCKKNNQASKNAKAQVDRTADWDPPKKIGPMA